jgi:hypothetical protein
MDIFDRQRNFEMIFDTDYMSTYYSIILEVGACADQDIPILVNNSLLQGKRRNVHS